MRYRTFLSSSLLAVTGCIGIANGADTRYPRVVDAPGGEIIIPDAESQAHHDEWRFAAARRMGDTLYVSGVIVHRRPGEGTDVTAYKQQVRRALNRLKFILESAGVTFADVAMINTFHVWQGPNFTGTRDEQFQAFEDVIDEFMKPPYPAWTAVGTTGLLSDGGIVEIQLIAHAKKQ